MTTARIITKNGERKAPEQQISPPFSDERNITHGRARIIWAPAINALDNLAGVAHLEGWVLPGGERTQNEGRAIGVCREMAAVMG